MCKQFCVTGQSYRSNISQINTYVAIITIFKCFMHNTNGCLLIKVFFLAGETKLYAARYDPTAKYTQHKIVSQLRW